MKLNNDWSQLVYLSSMLNGHHHLKDLPVVLLGGAGGKIKGGRVLNYKEQMEKIGVELDEFGDANEPLAEC